MDKYELIKRLGKGAFGSVWKAKKGDKEIALKIIKLKTPEMKNEAEKEVELLKTISMPCEKSLACYFGSEIIDDEMYIEMELINGETLTKFSQRYFQNKTKLSRALLALIGDLIYGIKYLHDKGIVHRDIKPDNIMIDLNYNPKLIDIGLGCIIKERNNCSDCCLGNAGTPLFMAPEALLNNVVYPISDIYSLGASIYYAYTRQYPYKPKRQKIKYLREAVKNGTPPSLNSPNSKLNLLVSRMLEKDPSKRINEDQIIEFISKVV